MPMPTGNLWWREALNSSHTIAFGIISFAISYRLSISKQFSNKIIMYFVVFVMAMILGFIVEAMQGLTSRDVDLSDILRNMVGILAGLCYASAVHEKNMLHKRAIVLRLLIGSCLLLTGFYPLMQLSWHYYGRSQAFPALTGFDKQWMSSFIRFNNAEMLSGLDAGRGKNTGLHRLQFNQGEYPGLSVIEPEPDWSKYSSLRITMFSRYDKSTNLVLRVHDKSHNQDHVDRFNKVLHLVHGVNEFDIPLSQIEQGPLGRELDLTNVAGIVLFASERKNSLQIELSDIYLK